jgi:hypothetical protein
VDFSKRPAEERVELNQLVERLMNIVYLLRLEPAKSQRIRVCLEIAEKDLERLQALIREPDVNHHDLAA